MKTQGRGRVFGPRRARIEDHDAMARSAAGRLAVVLLVFEAIRQARLGQDALHELQIRLAVLRASRARGQCLADVERKGRLGIIRKDVADDVLHGLILVDEAVAAQRQRGHPRRGVQAVAGQTAIGAQRVHAFDHGMPAAHRPIRLQQADGDLLAQQAAYIELGAGGQAVQRQREQARHAFAQRHLLGHQFSVQRRADAQHARLLRQGGDVHRRVGRGA